MRSGITGFVEFFAVLAFALGWAILELVASRLDKRRNADAERRNSSGHRDEHVG